MFRRHELVWLTPRGWDAALAQVPEHPTADAQRSVLAQWRNAGWPAVARRGEAVNHAVNQTTGAPGSTCYLGIAPPPDPHTGAKRRIALQADAGDVARSAPPLSIADRIVHAALPSAWRRAFIALAARATGLDVRVYGSLSWQALTHLPCVTPTSDIDLLFQPQTEQQLHAGLALLSAAQADLPLDGEIAFPTGQAVAWKEWLLAVHGEARVLVKQEDGVRLLDTHALLATLRSA